MGYFMRINVFVISADYLFIHNDIDISVFKIYKLTNTNLKIREGKL